MFFVSRPQCQECSLLNGSFIPALPAYEYGGYIRGGQEPAQPVAFVRQANIAHGPQQVNNGPAQLEKPSRARETGIQQNKLLEEHGERLDLKTPGAASETDSSLEAVGAVHRPKDSSR